MRPQNLQGMDSQDTAPHGDGVMKDPKISAMTDEETEAASAVEKAAAVRPLDAVCVAMLSSVETRMLTMGDDRGCCRDRDCCGCLCNLKASVGWPLDAVHVAQWALVKARIWSFGMVESL